MIVDLAEAWGRKVKGDVIRIIPSFFDGKASGADWWAFLTPVFPCKVCQTRYFIQY